LAGEQATYFAKWLPVLRKELMAFNILDYQLFLPHSRSYFTKVAHEASAFQIRNFPLFGVLKRPREEPIAAGRELRLREGKKRKV
jgi:hypothetical protein